MLVQHIAANEWRELATNFADLSYRQCDSYAKQAAAASNSGVEMIRLVEFGLTCGLCLVRVRTVRGLPFGIAYIHHGPLTTPRGGTFSAARFLDCAAALRDHYVGSRGLTLRIAPPNIVLEGEAAVRSALNNMGFRLGDSKPRHTILFDVRGDADLALASLGQKWRNSLRKAQKMEVVIEETRSDETFATLSRMLDQLEVKKGFRSPQNANFFRDVDRSACDYEAYRLFIAKSAGEIIAAHFGSYVGDTSVYLIGVSNDEARRLNASYLLHWRAVEETIKMGLRWYDLGGVDPEANASGYVFKKGMKGLEIEELGAFDCRPDFIRGYGLELIERLTRSTRGFQAKRMADVR